MKVKARALLVVVLLLPACGPPVPEPAPSEGPSVTVTFEPSAVATQVSNVSHIHISGAGPSTLFLFQGALSSYYLGKLKTEPVPDALLARQIPLVSWLGNGELVAAPLRVLSAGQYSLASESGLVSQFEVSFELPVLTRIWPPAADSASPRLSIYCKSAADSAPLPSGESLTLEPLPVTLQLAPGVDEAGTFAERCVHFSLDSPLDPEVTLVPAPVVGAWALAPALFSSAAPQVVVPLSCGAQETAFGPGCAIAADDRAQVRSPQAPVVWVVHTEHGSLVRVTEGGAPLVVGGLSPGASEHVWGVARDESGEPHAFDLALRTTAARERPILNEALADALGPEPQSEWVELFNDGTLAVDLASYSFQDSGGRISLPHAVLGPKSYALLVREDYAPSVSDEPPARDTQLIRLPTLGKSGLSNAGERLALVDGSGRELSVLPALAGKPGQSLARRFPAAPDDDPTSFVFGPPTPGAPNSAPSPAGSP